MGGEQFLQNRRFHFRGDLNFAIDILKRLAPRHNPTTYIVGSLAMFPSKSRGNIYPGKRGLSEQPLNTFTQQRILTIILNAYPTGKPKVFRETPFSSTKNFAAGTMFERVLQVISSSVFKL